MSAGPGVSMRMVVEMARVSPAAGISAAQVNDVLARQRKDGAQLESTVRDTLRRCVARELLWRGCRVGDVTRWFISAELADAWAALPAVRKPTRQLPMRQRLALSAQPVAEVSPALPAVLPAVLLDAAPVVVPRPVMTASGACYVPGLALSRSELQAGRVTARPPGEPFGAGFTAAGIGRDPQTGAAWR